MRVYVQCTMWSLATRTVDGATGFGLVSPSAVGAAAHRKHYISGLLFPQAPNHHHYTPFMSLSLECVCVCVPANMFANTNTLIKVGENDAKWRAFLSVSFSVALSDTPPPPHTHTDSHSSNTRSSKVWSTRRNIGHVGVTCQLVVFVNLIF